MKVYIAGPIAGYHDGNREDFARAAEWLRALGHEPVNPHDVEPHRHDGRECPPGPIGGQDAEHTAPCYMRTDLVAMLSCDAIYLLDGWQQSGGARIEYLVAVHVCGMRTFDGATYAPPAPPRSVRDAFALPSTLLEDEDGAPYPEGVQAIASERARQITELGYDAEHDARHPLGEFVGAALALLAPLTPLTQSHRWVRASGDVRDNLVRAGALMAAASDRLDGEVAG